MQTTSRPAAVRALRTAALLALLCALFTLGGVPAVGAPSGTTAPLPSWNDGPVNGVLVGTYWKLVEVAGQPVTVPEGERAPHLQLVAQGRRVQGYTGVNPFFGTFENSPGVLKFGPMAATRRAGPPAAMATETAFLKALGATTGYRVSPRLLELLAGERVVARFQEDNRR